MSELADGTRLFSSTIQAGGGHPQHLAGGAELMFQLDAELVQAHREVRALIDVLRDTTCSHCGELVLTRMRDVAAPSFERFREIA